MHFRYALTVCVYTRFKINTPYLQRIEHFANTENKTSPFANSEIESAMQLFYLISEHASSLIPSAGYPSISFKKKKFSPKEKSRKNIFSNPVVSDRNCGKIVEKELSLSPPVTGRKLCRMYLRVVEGDGIVGRRRSVSICTSGEWLGGAEAQSLAARSQSTFCTTVATVGPFKALQEPHASN